MSIFDKLSAMFGGKKEPTPPPAPTQTSQASKDDFYRSVLETDRSQKDSQFRYSPYSPLDPETRHTFDGLAYFPPNLALRLTLPLHKIAPEAVTLQTNTGDDQPFYKIGYVEFTVNDELARLYIYRGAENDDYFAPFRDATSGQTTYGAGRYLEPEPAQPDHLLIDFNTAYNPYCAYSANFVCPVPPPRKLADRPHRSGGKSV
jgi:uncharacterized protein (DUF1684 family)